MDYESIDYNRYRWNRMLLNVFWIILIITIILESMYWYNYQMPAFEFFTNYMLKPSVLQLALLLLAETAFRVLKGKFQDYILILTSALLAVIIVDIHNSINYLLLALFMPVMVSIFYFHPKKLFFALGTTLVSLYALYWTKAWMNDDITLVGMLQSQSCFRIFINCFGDIEAGRK